LQFQFNNTYLQLPNNLYTAALPSVAIEPQLVILNEPLAAALGLTLQEDTQEVLSGKKTANGSANIAQAYAGHQFGHFAMLGDGRAILLGEHVTLQNNLVDVVLKGAGTTAYSRRGDGQCTLSAALREYLISESVYGLGIPSTRSLAVCTTGAKVFRGEAHDGAVLTRVASSHLRVGTFEYARHFCSTDVLQALCNYAIERHYPACAQAENPVFAFLQAVMQKQLQLIINWVRVGFIHGVMNTDNMSISGETIDYGPCAFMNSYDPATVYSEIDTGGRYAYGAQPNIMHWNLARFAEALIPVLHSDKESAIALAQEALDACAKNFEQSWLQMMRCKIGLLDKHEDDMQLLRELLVIMQGQQADFTNTFLHLTYGYAADSDFYLHPLFIAWKKKWQKRLGNETPNAAQLALMQANNPCLIPRNHLVEQALAEATQHGDLSLFKHLLATWSKPYLYDSAHDALRLVPAEFEQHYSTHCNT
jgi:uncharacterized protein YdiU (UPF0061 family)